MLPWMLNSRALIFLLIADQLLLKTISISAIVIYTIYSENFGRVIHCWELNYGFLLVNSGSERNKQKRQFLSLRDIWEPRTVWEDGKLHNFQYWIHRYLHVFVGDVLTSVLRIRILYSQKAPCNLIFLLYNFLSKIQFSQNIFCIFSFRKGVKNTTFYGHVRKGGGQPHSGNFLLKSRCLFLKTQNALKSELRRRPIFGGSGSGADPSKKKRLRLRLRLRLQLRLISIKTIRHQ